MRIFKPFGVALLVCLFATRLLAQTNTGSIAGHVADPKGLPVAGASIIVKNTDLTATRTTVSDAHGDFRVTGLVPGALTVEAKGQGMSTRRPVRITLGLGSTVQVALALSVAPVAQKTTVTARRDTAEGNTLAPPVNKEEASVSSFFAGQTVTYLPNRDRDYAQFGQLGAGITEDADAGGVVVAGQRVTGIITQVDGLSFNDPLQGGRRGASDGSFFLPQTVVREFQIVRSGVTADVGDTNAGLINVATKEGSNRVHGESFLTTRPGWATSADAFGHQLDNRQNTFGLSYGGAIRHDKLFWYAGFEQDFLYAPTYLQLEPQASAIAVPTNFTALQGQILQKNSPGAISVRLDELANEKNTLNLLVVVNRIRGSNIGDGSTRSVASIDHTDSLSGQSLLTHASLATVVSGRSLNQLTVAYSGDHRNTTPNSTAPEQVINGFATFGGDSLGPHLYTSDQLQLADTFSITRGGASLDLGGGFNYDPSYEQQEANLHGRYDYNSLANYLANAPRRFQQTFATGNTRYMGSIRTGQLFANAKAPLTKALTLTAGLRWDAQFNPAPSAPNAAIAQNQTIPNDLTQFQPRVGLAWTPASKTTIRLSAGLYDAPTPGTIFHRVNADNGKQTIVADSYFDPQVLVLAAGAPHSLPTPPPTLTTPAALVVGIAPGFRNPRSMQLAATAEQQVKPHLSISAGYLHDETWRLQQRLDENLSPPSSIVNGLPIFPLTRPNPSIGRLLVNQSSAHSNYDGLLLSSVSQIGARSSLTINYTLSETHDDDSGASPYGIDDALDPYNLKLERAFSSQDVRQVLNVAGIFNLPFGLKTNPIFLARSGRPYTPIIGFDTQNDANDWNDRALINGVTAARNSMRQPAFTDVDLRFVKDFTLKGMGRHLDLFMDIFNLIGTGNRNFGPDGVSVYGNAANPVFSAGQALFAPNGTRVGGPREVQFTARLVGF
jgi:Carboxypeptidase regulatory-like domain/TonB dependent receptor